MGVQGVGVIQTLMVDDLQYGFRLHTDDLAGDLETRIPLHAFLFAQNVTVAGVRVLHRPVDRTYVIVLLLFNPLAERCNVDSASH